MNRLKDRYTGSREFYIRIIAIMLPALTQNLVTNFVSLLDNLMVGQMGTEPMSGVAIANQILFIFNQCVFGGISGAGIFTAQFFGKGDREGFKGSVRSKLRISIIILAVFMPVFIFCDDALLSLFIHNGSDASLDLAVTLESGRRYLRIMLVQMPIFALSYIYAGTLRESGNTRLPMLASFAAVAVNLVGDYVLIFGKLGFATMGVSGAAAATVFSRIVELVIVVSGSRAEFDGVWSSLHVPRALSRQVIDKAMPLMINELMWSGGLTALMQIMSRMGVEVVSAENICNTVANLFYCAIKGMGMTVPVIVGQHLGAGRFEEAVEDNRKLTFFAVALNVFVAVIMAAAAPFIPKLYKTTSDVRTLAAAFILINALLIPAKAYMHMCYFTLRSGGRVWITFIYDSGYLWVLAVPITWLLVRYSSMSVIAIYAISNLIDLAKVAVGYFLVKNRTWVRNLVSNL